jgi:hypothetical protein
MKKNGTVWVYINSSNINAPIPKDDFPLPFIDQLVDAIVGYEMMSVEIL